MALPPVRNTWSGVVHALAECDECDFEAGNHKNALALGNQHARRSGHQVHVEQCISVTYNRPDDHQSGRERAEAPGG